MFVVIVAGLDKDEASDLLGAIKTEYDLRGYIAEIENISSERHRIKDLLEREFDMEETSLYEN